MSISDEANTVLDMVTKDSLHSFDLELLQWPTKGIDFVGFTGEILPARRLPIYPPIVVKVAHSSSNDTL